MRKKLNQLIKKYVEYVPIILKLSSEEINAIYDMTEEQAIEKLQTVEKVELQKLQNISNEKFLFYSNC